jgi:anti-anti-sigma factor
MELPSLDEFQEGDMTVLSVRGELDLAAGLHIEKRLADLSADGRHRIVLDLEGVPFCNGRGIRILARQLTGIQARGGWPRLARANTSVRTVIEMLDLAEDLPDFASPTDALAGRERTRDHSPERLSAKQ